jgi:DNA-binding response OmpR family regulator
VANILVIDSDSRRLQETAAALRQSGAETQTVATTAEAGPLLTAQPPPDVVVVAGTPDAMVGIADFCARLKTAASTVKTLFAYVPGDQEAGRLRLLENGADDVVTGPAWLTELRTVVAGGRADSQAAGQQQMFFKLKTGELGNVLQFLNFSARNGRLDITFANDHGGGHLYLAQGEVIHAECAGLTGMEAIAEMLGQGDAEGQFFETSALPPPEMALPLSQVMIEATVLADENREARQAFADLNAFPRREAPACPEDSAPEELLVWNEIDGATPVGVLVAELGLELTRGLRALNKLLAAGAINVQPGNTPAVTLEARLDSLLRRTRRRVLDATTAERRGVLLAHLETLASLRAPSPNDYLGTTLVHFPDSVSIQFATCRCSCGNQALQIEGSPVACARCGTPLLPRNRAVYRLG